MALQQSREDARLYDAVSGCSKFAIDLGINIPTEKDSLSMKQKYSDGMCSLLELLLSQVSVLVQISIKLHQ